MEQVMEQEIRKLIDEYEKILHDHRQEYIPVELTTKEQYRLEGYNSALFLFISRLKDILYRSKYELSLKEKLDYTE